MDVRLSPEQEALRDAAARVVHQLGPTAVGQLEDLERVAKLHAAVVASGWLELRAPDESGRPWASAVEVAIVAEELARGLADVAFIGPTLAVELRRLAARPNGELPATIAVAPDLSALARGTGSAVAVDAAGAEIALGLDQTATLVSFAVAGDRELIDLTRPSVRLEAGPSHVEGALPIDAAALEGWTALGLALTSADLVGTMRGALQLARDYAAERRQYGAAIGSFQAVQHLLADAFTLSEGARSVTLHAAWAVDALPPSRALAAGAVAKAYCARAARSVCETAIQVHGGIGNTWDCLAHVYLRRALLSTDLLGGIGPNLERVLAYEGLADGSDRGLR